MSATEAPEAHTCIKGCGKKTEKKHCSAGGCPWFVCVDCKIAFLPGNLKREIPWKDGQGDA